VREENVGRMVRFGDICDRTLCCGGGHMPAAGD